MKKSIITKAMILAMGLIGISCSEEAGGYGSGAGRIAPSVGCDSDVEGMGQTLSRAGDEITVDDLSMTLSKDDGSYRHTWDKVSDFDKTKEFGVGNYTLTAFYGDPESEGFEKPAYSGSVPVRVSDGQTSRVSLTATVVNAKISVVFTDEFKKYMTDYSGQFVTAKGTYEYTKDETRPLYIAPGSATFTVRVVKPNGQEGSFNIASINAQARHHYVITVNVNGGNVSDASMTVSFDDTLEHEPVIIDLSDKIMSKPAPEIATEGFTAGSPVNLIAGVTNNAKAQLTLTAMAGFKSVTLNTESSYLIANGWPESIDLLAATSAEQTMMTDKGLKVVGLWKNPGTMALIDFAPMAEFLTAGTARFTVSVTDILSRTVEAPVTVELNLAEPEFSIANIADTYFSDDMPVSFTLTANIPLSKENLKVEYKNKRGTTSEAEIIEFTESSARSASYKLTIKTPADIEDRLTVKLICGRIGSNELEISPVPFALSFADNDIFATHAYMDVVGVGGAPAPDLSQVQIVIEEADGKFTNASQTVSGSCFDVKSLTPGKAYTVRAKVGNIYSNRSTFTTEAATQLPNAGMEEWNTTGSANQSSYKVQLPVGWGTMNYRTTSSGGVNAEYVRNNGTKPTTDSHSGNAALIRTVGWGNGNTAGGNASIVKHVTQGELYLGANPTDPNVDPTYPVKFGSRPSSLKFFAKYTVGKKASGDLGLVEAEIYDANGNVIGTGSLTIAGSDNYNEYTINFSYSRGTPKADKIKVLFRSTNDISKYVTKNALELPAFMTGKESVGSSLYIDDIELTY